jgi:hypothetical protein
MATTALDLIKAAMSKNNVLAAGETPSAEDASVGLDRLNALMTALENESIFNYTTTRTTVSLPANTVSRTVGAAQQVAMVRPIEFLRGSFSRLNNIDYPLEPVSEQEYNSISLKSTLNAIAPEVMFYDGGAPTGVLYFWPPVAATVEVHLLSPAPGGEATSTATEYNFAPGYRRMIENGLAVELAPDFNVTPHPLVVALYMSAKRQLKRTNSRIPHLTLPGRFGRRSDITSDWPS